MSRFLKQWKTIAVMAVFVIAVAASGFVSEAKTISKTVNLDKKIAYVGEEESFSDVISVKIDNKATSKSKKKIKTSKTYSDPTGFSYHTKAYFADSSAYSQYDDYRNAYSNAIKYVTETNYTLRFLKPGTYTISYVKYGDEDLSMVYNSSEYVGGKFVYYYKLEDNDGKLSSELFEEKVVNGDYYYQGVSSKKIYAVGNEGLVAASIKTGVDKQQHIYYQPRNIVKTTYSRQYKVLKTSKIISSVQLGKTKLTRADSKGAYSSSSSSQRTFLSGNSGKLTAKTADKNYIITSIVVLTYDKEGKPVYTKVSNKKKINYGLNKRMSSFSSQYSSYSYSNTSLYKETTVYVSYKNKFTGAFLRVDSIAKDKYGHDIISYTYRNAGDTKNSKGTAYSMGLYMGNGCTESYTFYKK
ncbi:MAG: hypothetical protein K2L07_01670 [Lachnospiraceae bacterium]|nr:hypothetical protein [Lachnospiraceae bacterium]